MLGLLCVSLLSAASGFTSLPISPATVRLAGRSSASASPAPWQPARATVVQGASEEGSFDDADPNPKEVDSLRVFNAKKMRARDGRDSLLYEVSVRDSSRPEGKKSLGVFHLDSRTSTGDVIEYKQTPYEVGGDGANSTATTAASATHAINPLPHNPPTYPTPISLLLAGEVRPLPVPLPCWCRLHDDA